MRHGNSFIQLIVYILTMAPFSSFSTEPPRTLNFADFPSEFSTEGNPLLPLQHQVVQIRGFWYPISADKGILSPFPGLKSCCLTSSAKLPQQLLVKTKQLSSLPALQVVTLEGIFNIEPLYNGDGEPIQFYTLEEVREVPKANSYIFLVFLLGLSLGFSIWRFFRKNLPKKNNCSN
jgi:hypothetical protein